MTIRLYPPVWFLTILVSQWVVMRAVPSAWGPLNMLSPLGWGLIIGGAAVFASAGVAFRKHRTTILPFEDTSKRLIRTGVFQLSRNPIYLGEAIILAGTALLSGQLWPWLATAVFVIGIDRNVIAWEEQTLKRKFGEEFEDYCRTTGRWL